MAMQKKIYMHLIFHFVGFSFVSLNLLFCSAVFSQQIQADKTLGNNFSDPKSDVLVNGAASTLIQGGVAKGENLFHSFQEFNIDVDQNVYFYNPSGIERIIARVTGRNSSTILGKLGVDGGNADLFLLNPHGIIFGQNSSLDLNGSFLATTASSFIFPDIEYSTDATETISPLLSVEIPVGLQFRGASKEIINKSSVGDLKNGLQVKPGNVIALVAGNVILDDGHITAPEGRVELGGVTGLNQVALGGNDLILNYSRIDRKNFGNITLTNNSTIVSVNGGDINLQGKLIKVDDASELTTIVQTGTKPGGTTRINASDSFVLDGGSSLVTSTLSAGNTGGVEINARNNVFLRDESYIQSASTGTSINGIISLASGNAGNISVTTNLLEMSGGASINSATNGVGAGGDIKVNASDSINIFGVSLNDSNTVIFTDAGRRSSGPAGNIFLETRSLRVAEGAQISVDSSGKGAAGELEVKSPSILLENGGTLSADTVAGSGNIKLISNNIFIRGNSFIKTNASGEANGGNIRITTDNFILADSAITANAVKGFGGDITVNAAGIFISPNSKITASSDAGPQFSGTVNLNNTATNPNQGLVELPTTVLDPNTIVSQQPCDRGWNSSFTLKSRGGTPQTPRQDLSPAAIQVGLVEPAPIAQKTAATPNNKIASTNLQQPTEITIVPAQGWVYNKKGEVTLVAYNPTLTVQQRLQQQPVCSANE